MTAMVTLISTKTVTLSKTKPQILVEDDLTPGFKKTAELWLLVDWQTVQGHNPEQARGMAHPGEGGYAICLQVIRGTGMACPQSSMCTCVLAGYCLYTHERWNGSISSYKELLVVVYFWQASLRGERIQNSETWSDRTLGMKSRKVKTLSGITLEDEQGKNWEADDQLVA